MNADIALIKLDRPATLSNQVGLACLPEHNDDVDLKASCYISGNNIFCLCALFFTKNIKFTREGFLLLAMVQ